MNKITAKILKNNQTEDRDIWEKLSNLLNEATSLQKIAEVEIHVPTAETRVSASAQLNHCEERISAHGTSKPTLVNIDDLLRAHVL